MSTITSKPVAWSLKLSSRKKLLALSIFMKQNPTSINGE
jgi:hypothetical protein